MKNLLLISNDEKKRILDMHKKTQNNFLSESVTSSEYTEEEFLDLRNTLDTKINKIVLEKKDTIISEMKLIGQFIDNDYTFRIWSPSNESVGIKLLKSGGEVKTIGDYYSVTIDENKKRAIGSVDISTELPTILSSLTERQKEIMNMSIPNVEGYSFTQLLNDFKPTLIMEGLENNKAMITGEIVTVTTGNAYPDSACGGLSTYAIGEEFEAIKLIKTVPDGNTKTLKICYGGLLLKNRTLYFKTNTTPFDQMLSAKQRQR